MFLFLALKPQTIKTNHKKITKTNNQSNKKNHLHFAAALPVKYMSCNKYFFGFLKKIMTYLMMLIHREKASKSISVKKETIINCEENNNKRKECIIL